MEVCKRCFMLAAYLPLLFQTPYLLTAWRTSPLDQYDWIFWIAVLISFSCLLPRIQIWRKLKADNRFHLLGLLPVGFALAVYIYGSYTSISLLTLTACILFLGGMVWFLYGEPTFSGLLPIFGLMVLGCPSTSYWTGYWLEPVLNGAVSGFQIKLMMGGILLLWMSVFSRPPRLRSYLFPAFFLLFLFLVVYQQKKPAFGASLSLNLERNQYDSWLGVEEPMTVHESRFFKGSKAVKKTFFRNEKAVYLLGIELGNTVSTIHPTELCLKSGGREIHGNREILIRTKYGYLAVQEIQTVHRNETFLIYTWYVNDKWSTGNFIRFRRAWKREKNWNTFQIMTPADKDLEQTRKRLLDFLNSTLEPSDPIKK